MGRPVAVKLSARHVRGCVVSMAMDQIRSAPSPGHRIEERDPRPGSCSAPSKFWRRLVAVWLCPRTKNSTISPSIPSRTRQSIEPQALPKTPCAQLYSGVAPALAFGTFLETLVCWGDLGEDEVIACVSAETRLGGPMEVRAFAR